jgi:hypothetical protein
MTPEEIEAMGEIAALHTQLLLKHNELFEILDKRITALSKICEVLSEALSHINSIGMN